VTRVDFGPRTEELEGRANVVRFPVFEQLELQKVARVRTVLRRFAVHQVDAADALVRRQADASPEQVQQDIAVLRKHGPN
jgi:hypothetical protein